MRGYTRGFVFKLDAYNWTHTEWIILIFSVSKFNLISIFWYVIIILIFSVNVSK